MMQIIRWDWSLCSKSKLYEYALVACLQSIGSCFREITSGAARLLLLFWKQHSKKKKRGVIKTTFFNLKLSSFKSSEVQTLPSQLIFWSYQVMTNLYDYLMWSRSPAVKLWTVCLTKNIRSRVYTYTPHTRTPLHKKKNMWRYSFWLPPVNRKPGSSKPITLLSVKFANDEVV